MIRKLKALGLVVSMFFMGLAACSSGGGDTRTVLVDYQTDEFAGIFLGYYPRAITVKPGMTVKFEQTWTGEPHSVTMGRIVDEGYKPIRSLLDDYLSGETPIPDQPPAEYDEEIWDERLPFMFGDDDVNQSAALPCYLPKESDFPEDKAKPCPKKFREEQPAFDGSFDYYSSGFIPFEGELANKFEVEIAEDTPDGTYGYYCNLHGLLMSGEITVDRDADVESQGDINRRGRDEAERAIKPLKENLDKERAGKGAFPLPLAGSGSDELESMANAAVNEFTPRTIETKVGEKVTWTFINDHTISFNVPPYSPIFTFDDRGFMEFNENLDKARGGWPGAPEREEESGPPQEGDTPPEPVAVDAGEWDGSGGLHSSGTGWETGDKYSVTFTKAGTYPYACLIHPGQIGKVVVS